MFGKAGRPQNGFGTNAIKNRRTLLWVRGVRDLIVEQQTLIPQIKIEYDRERLLAVGLTVEVLNRLIETVMNGQVVSEVMQGQPTFDLVVRLKDDAQRTIEHKMESFE